MCTLIFPMNIFFSYLVVYQPVGGESLASSSKATCKQDKLRHGTISVSTIHFRGDSNPSSLLHLLTFLN